MLQISAIGDAAVYLLNPQVITKNGEWEAWFFANWLPGAHRYRSFQELMQGQYTSFAALDWQQPVGIFGGLPDEYVGSPGSSHRRLKAATSADDGPSLDELLAALQDTDLALRLFPKAKQLGLPGRMSGMTPEGEARCRVVEALERRGDRAALAPLMQMLYSEQDHRVRNAIVRALGTLGGEACAEALLPLVDEGGNLGITAMYALKKDCPDRLIEPLLRELERSGSSVTIAAILLAELGEPRALPLLTHLVENPGSVSIYDAPSLAQCIARFPTGLKNLKYLLSNPDLAVRRLAAAALGHVRFESQRAEVRALLESLLNDADSTIRESAGIGLHGLAPIDR
jgi:HEAT repeat protein